MTLVCYTDASYCSSLNVGACGFTVYRAWQLIKHDILLVGNIGSIKYSEAFAMSAALQYCFLKEGITGILLFTDQIDARSRNDRKAKFQYKELNEVIDIIEEHGIWVEIKYTKAHTKDKFHNKVDKSCNTALREYRNEKGIHYGYKKKETPVWSSMYPKGRRSA